MELLAMIAVLVAIYVIAKQARRKRPGDTIKGRVKVTAADGRKVVGYMVRLAGLDALEWNRPAEHRWGFWFSHGKRVKRALEAHVGGRRVRVTVEGFDRCGRVLATVSCRGVDAGERLVRSGHAIACFDNRCKDAERAARSERSGMWGYGEVIDPREWRRRKS